MTNWRLFPDCDAMQNAPILLKITATANPVYRVGVARRYKDKWCIFSKESGYFYFSPSANHFYLNLNEIL